MLYDESLTSEPKKSYSFLHFVLRLKVCLFPLKIALDFARLLKCSAFVYLFRLDLFLINLAY